jgi:uncharacterized repeat protein (TIGR04138 family)
MIDPSHAAARKIRRDGRYSFEAYNFILEAMEYARDDLGMGREAESQLPPGESAAHIAARTSGQKHVTGQQLCEAVRIYALRQFGYMARCVFHHWGIDATSDIGEIVFNMIRLNVMLKTPQDRREDFDDVYEFEQGFAFDFHKAMRDVEPAS